MAIGAKMKKNQISKENAKFFIHWVAGYNKGYITAKKPYIEPINNLTNRIKNYEYFFTNKKYAEAYIRLYNIAKGKHSIIFKDLSEMINNAIISEQKIPKINLENVKITKIEKSYLEKFYNEFQEIIE